MLAAHTALLTLIGLTPLLLFFDSLLVDGIVELYTAFVLTMVALSIRPGEAGHWLKTVRWAVVLAIQAAVFFRGKLEIHYFVTGKARVAN